MEQVKSINVFEDKAFIWQLENSMMPKIGYEKQKLIISDHNECDKKVYAKLTEIRDNINDFVKSGKSIYICGDVVGNGKTSWAVKLLQQYLYNTRKNAYFDEVVTGLFISVPELIANLKDFTTKSAKKYMEYVKANIERVKLIIWDDFALEETSSYDRLQLYVFLNNRILNKQASIFTSNIVEPKDLDKIVGARIKSRSYDVSEIITLNGKGAR